MQRTRTLVRNLGATTAVALLVLTCAPTNTRADIDSTNVTSATIQVVDIRDASGNIVTPTDLTLSGFLFLNSDTQHSTPGFSTTSTPTVSVPSSLTPGGAITLGASQTATGPTAFTPGDSFVITQLGAAITYANLSATSDYTINFLLTYSYNLTQGAISDPRQSGEAETRIVVSSGGVNTVLDTGLISTLSTNPAVGSGTVNFSSVALHDSEGSAAGLGIGASVDVDAVPEPGPLLLGLVGLAGAGGWTFVRRRVR